MELYRKAFEGKTSIKIIHFVAFQVHYIYECEMRIYQALIWQYIDSWPNLSILSEGQCDTINWM